LSTLGPGALNFTTGAAHALLGAMPMVMITGQKAIKSARQARFQIVDTVAAMRPLTKMTRQSVSAASIPTVVREAFRVASELLKRERRAGRTKPFEANESTISASRSENAASGR
jgi:acetolactate synthase-1/2/3 large subunit